MSFVIFEHNLGRQEAGMANAFGSLLAPIDCPMTLSSLSLLCRALRVPYRFAIMLTQHITKVTSRAANAAMAS